jgi:hypothetical protein
MERPVYNLEFRPNSTRLDIAGYSFQRVPDYADAQARLQYLVTSQGSEFSTKAQTGEHAHTANVTVPDNEPAAIIAWQHANPTALDDVMLLLRLFTHRDVFALSNNADSDEPFAIIADPRNFPWGGVLSCSIPYECDRGDDPHDTVDTSLSVHLPRIYDRMSEDDWKRDYGGGYFLVLLSQAIQQRLLEAAFGQCWTIWEHLFACLTGRWLSNRGNRQLSAKEKIAYLLVHFGVREDLADTEKSRLDSLVEIRNRLIHFGLFPEQDAVRHDAMMFIRMTEYIAAKSLGLFPSNAFNTIERLEEFLANDRIRGT